MTTDSQTIPPELWSIIVAAASVLIRWLEKKLLQNKAKQVSIELEEAQKTADLPTTREAIDTALASNKRLIKTLSATSFPNNIIKK